MNRDQMNALVDVQLNALIAAVQEKINVTSGDVASHVFSSDDVRDALVDAMLSYVRVEMSYRD